MNQPRLVPTVGARRRIYALGALGWTRRHIGDAAGLRPESLRRVLVSPTLTRATNTAINQAYAELSMTVGPSERTRLVAATKGWAPPLAWDDDDIDDPHAKPHTGHGADRHLDTEVRRLDRRGLGVTAIARQLGRHRRVVTKVRDRLRREAGEAA